MNKLKNSCFDISISKEDGTITSLLCQKDIHSMNWCSGITGWGSLRFLDDNMFFDPQTQIHHTKGMCRLSLKEITTNDDECVSVYEGWDIRVTVIRSFDEDGYLNERYILKNLRKSDLFLEQGAIGIALPFNDIYSYADDCMLHRCNTHLWCGGNTAYVQAVKMGESDINLGLVLTEGAVASYSLSHANMFNHRGVFVLDCEHMELLAGEEYVWNWKLFWYKDYSEFKNIISRYNRIEIEAEQYTVFYGEPMRCYINVGFEPKKLSVMLQDTVLTPVKKDGRYYVEYVPEQYGDCRLTVEADGIHTYAEFYVIDTPNELIRKRVSFIAEKQQYNKKESPLYGAYLIYDTRKEHLVFDSLVRDHNACRERMGMSLLMCRYLQNHEDASLRASLDKFVAFLEREFYDTETGEVFDGIGKDRQYIRLYNAPWVVTFLTEMYYLTKEKKYLEYCVKSLDVYYAGGGYKFYPNGISMWRTYCALRDAGMSDECGHVTEHFRKHVDNIVKNGTSYPKHEVNYEQTIVSPAVTFLSEFAMISGDDFYMHEAAKHIKMLERFNGHQPSCHLNETPIRYWDDIYFGCERTQGDTFPHYWSCLTARSFMDYYMVSGDTTYRDAAFEGIRNCLCLFNEKGEASCAYVYPYRVNERMGAFYDGWANDQDFALYFYLTMFDGAMHE